MYNGIVTGLHLWSLLNKYKFVVTKINSHKIEKSKFFEAILLSYVLTSIEIINGFKTYFNIFNWDLKRFIYFFGFIVFLIVVEYFVNKAKNQ